MFVFDCGKTHFLLLILTVMQINIRIQRKKKKKPLISTKKSHPESTSQAKIFKSSTDLIEPDGIWKNCMLEPTEMKTERFFFVDTFASRKHQRTGCVGTDDCSSPRWCPRAAGRGSVSPTSLTAAQKHPARGDLKLAAELAQRLLMLTDRANPGASSLRGSTVQLGNAVSRCSSVANKRHVQPTQGNRAQKAQHQQLLG